MQCWVFFNLVDSSSFLFKLILRLNRSLISSNFYHALTSFTIMYLVWFKTPIFTFQKSWAGFENLKRSNTFASNWQCVNYKTTLFKITPFLNALVDIATFIHRLFYGSAKQEDHGKPKVTVNGDLIPNSKDQNL